MSNLYNLIDKELTLTFINLKTGKWEKTMILSPSGLTSKYTGEAEEMSNIFSVKMKYKYGRLPSKSKLANIPYAVIADNDNKNLFIVDREEGLRRKLAGENVSNLRIPGNVCFTDAEHIVAHWLEEI